MTRNTLAQPQADLLPLPQLVERALKTAAFAHRNQMRKGTAMPYIVHPYAVALMLQSAGCHAEVIAAGLLHDVAEDTSITLATLRAEFGEHIAMIVEYCTEDKSKSWEVRKQQMIASLREAPLAVKFVAAADKLDNLRSIAAEHRHIGENVWARFNRGREQQAWYYQQVTQSLLANLPGSAPPQLFALLQEEVASFLG